MSQVLGISVTDLEIASVVADSGTGEVLARNFVELSNSSPDHVFDAIYQLVQSAPVLPGAITIACADSATVAAIGEIIDSGRLPAHLLPHHSPAAATSDGAPSTPDWFARTTVVGSPVAYAEIAAAIFGARGLVLVADLDRTGALFPGQSVALVDTNTRTVVGASEISGVGLRPPVTEPDGAQLVGDAIGVIPNATGGFQGIAVLGPGAVILGVAPSLEYALQLPVQVAEDGQYATAYGAAMVAAAAVGVSNNNRWVLLSAAAAAALFVAIGVITAVVMTSNTSEPKTAVDEQPTTSEFSSSTTTTTTTKSTPRTTTSAPPPPPPETTTTEAPPVVEEPETVTVVPPPTTITQVPSPPPSPSPSPSAPPPSETPSSPPVSVSPPVDPGEGEEPPGLPELPNLPRLLPPGIPQ